MASHSFRSDEFDSQLSIADLAEYLGNEAGEVEAGRFKSPTRLCSGLRSHRWQITNEILDLVLPIWIKIFTISCVLAVFFDPLFLYIPIVNEDIKCLTSDQNLKKAALILRSLTDFFYVLDIIIQISKFNATSSKILINHARFRLKRDKSATRISLSCLLIDIFAVLPFPQVVIFTSFSKMRGSRSFKRMFLYSFVLFQYVPRVLRIYLTSNTPSIQTRIGIWIKAVFNFFPFILAGHVLGAILYFFAIHREATCWDYACRIENGCEANYTFSCDDNAMRNITLLNYLCPINPPNTTVFDFGLFISPLQSGMQLGSTNFSRKLLQCFWWGLRNLSSLGSNLQTSSNEWENVFAVFIFLSGMILFLVYLSATLQTLSVQLETIKSEKLKFRRKMQLISPEIDLWLNKNDLPTYLKKVIIDNVKQKLEENKDVDVENILSILPLRHRRDIMTRLRMASLKKVPMLNNMGEKVLNAISRYLKPVIYAEDNYIIQEGEPLEKMLFIRQGTAWSYTTSNGGRSDFSNTKCLEKGDFYGEELLNWALKSGPLPELPISTRIVKSQTKVEAFTIRAMDLKTVVTKFWWHFRKELSHLEEYGSEDWEHLAMSSVKANWRHYHSRVTMRRNAESS